MFSSLLTLFESNLNVRDSSLQVNSDGTLSFNFLLLNGASGKPAPETNYLLPGDAKGSTRGSDLNCPICLDALEVEDVVMQCPNNHHFFHKNCLSKWMFHQKKKFDNLSGTCPVCRDKLQAHAATLSSYLEHSSDMHLTPDERTLNERALNELNQYRSWFVTNKRQLLRNAVYTTAFCFGAYKGFSLNGWSFTQDILYFTLPYRLRVATSFGYILGVGTRGTLAVIKQVNKTSSRLR